MDVRIKNTIKPLTDKVFNDIVSDGNGWGPDAYWSLFNYVSNGSNENFEIGTDDIFIIYGNKVKKVPVKFSDLYILIIECKVEERNLKLKKLGI